MIETFRIRNYRGFSDIKLGGLKKVNLLVGKNNAGKSSILEALRLFAFNGSPWSIHNLSSIRGEQVPRFASLGATPPQPEIELIHCFRGHAIDTGQEFSLSSTGKFVNSITYSVVPYSTDAALPITPSVQSNPPKLALKLTCWDGQQPPLVPLTGQNSIAFDVMGQLNTWSFQNGTKPQIPNMYITPYFLGAGEIMQLWSKASLTEVEDRVIKVLRSIEPNLERIAPITENIIASNRGGFRVKLKGLDAPVPIGSLGDGVWWMFALGLSISQAKDGFLFIDEIEAGLHYSVMEKLWSFIAEAAKDYNVQIFATTHSYDCVQSLATVCMEGVNRESISIQRIRPGGIVSYTEDEIVAATERNIEMR